MNIRNLFLKFNLSNYRIYKFYNFLSKDECNEWIKKCPKFIDYSWDNRTIDITNENFGILIGNKVQKFLEEKFNIKTNLKKIQLQIWPINCTGELHVHHDINTPKLYDFNSLIYLNDDFKGGEFFTKNKKIKPKQGLLTFFNGNEIWHGVKTVKNNHRYTIIFWWSDTVKLN